MDITNEIQILLFKWFQHHGKRSIQQIRVACKNLMGSFCVEQKYYLFYYFYPLLRIGVIEFAGNGIYQVAPPVIIYNEGKGISTIVNFPSNHITKLKEKFELHFVNDFGMINLFGNPDEIRAICLDSELNYSDAEISEMLTYFPSVKAVVQNFEETINSNLNFRRNITTFSWETPIQENLPGIYISEKDSMVFTFLDETGKCYKIPAMEKNPEARFVAECYQAILDQKPVMHYNKMTKEFIVKRINLPILIDRILQMPSLWSGNGKINKHGLTIFSNISFKAYKQLNRIFCHTLLTQE